MPSTWQFPNAPQIFQSGRIGKTLGASSWSSVYRAAGSGWKIAKVLPSES
ncbi:MAG: hypothetical protein M3Z85_15335 [Acidobacteriota bacterium]|nr:hypothetical protein [Acidobacteriota bacterium]